MRTLRHFAKSTAFVGRALSAASMRLVKNGQRRKLREALRSEVAFVMVRIQGLRTSRTGEISNHPRDLKRGVHVTSQIGPRPYEIGVKAVVESSSAP